MLLLTACDRAYLPHALTLARSLDAFAPGQHLMLHLVNPDAASRDAVDALRATLRTLRVHVSTEKVQLPEGASKAAYYASARFLRMAELLNLRSDTPVLALDADALAVDDIPLDFSDKSEAEICLRLRTTESPDDTHLSVAAGAVWARSTPRSRAFFDAVATDLEAAFASGQAEWFVDQEVLGRHVALGTAEAKVRNLKSRYADWNLGDDAVFWMGKGDRKFLDVRYLLLRDSLDPDPDRRGLARDLHARYRARVPPDHRSVVMERAQRVFEQGRTLRTAIYLPRLDLPWKPEGLQAGGHPPPQGADTIELRLWWKHFAMAAQNALLRAGVECRTLELPAWEITPERIDGDSVDLALVPHRDRSGFERLRTPARYFMQAFMRPVFTLDAVGWGAASSVYPVDAAQLPAAVLGAWDAYRDAMLAGTLGSKFTQARRRSLEALRLDGAIPQRPYLFVPLQVPHDQSIARFSDVSMMELVEAALALAQGEGLELVLKAHPANPTSMAPFRESFGAGNVHWTEAHVHDAISQANCVVTINSGCGFEALLAGVPVVTMGRVEYDAVTHCARPDTLRDAWALAVAESEDQRLRRYARFVDWFLARHAIDLSRPAAAEHVLQRHLAGALADARRHREMLHAD